MLFHLRNPKTVLKKSLIGLILFCFGAIASYLFAVLFAPTFLRSLAHHPMVPIFMTTLVALMAYKPIEHYVKKFLEQYIFHKKSFAHLTLMDLAEDLSVNLDLQEVANLVVNTFGEVLHLKAVALLVPDPLASHFEIASAYGWPISTSKRLQLSMETPLVRLIQRTGPHVLVRGPLLQSLPWQEANALAQDFDLLRAGWIIPLFTKGELAGLIAFGTHFPDATFDQTDFHFFREFAAAIAKCVANASIVRRLKQINLELQDAQSQWVQVTKLTAIEQLAAGIAHEIHNPLAIISGKAQVLLMRKGDKKLAADIEEALQTIVKQTRRAADITRKLLMYSQNAREPKEWLHLEKVLNASMALVAYQASMDHIEITTAIDPGLPEYYGNVQEVREIFLNLFLNAAEAIGAHGKIHVQIQHHVQDEIIEVRFSDTGKGMSAEDLEKLFNPFFTTRHEALGLGLFVTQQIVRRYGGSIRAESRLNEGSLFIIQLPCAEKKREVQVPKEEASIPTVS